MRLSGFEREGRTWIGVSASDGTLVPIAEADAFYGDLPGHRVTAAAAMRAGGGLRRHAPRAPVGPSSRIFCVGLNYLAHAREGGRTDDLPEFPTIFGRWTQSLNADGLPVPAVEERLDYEGELAVVIGEMVRGASPDAALEAVFGYAAFNDISARSYQRHTPQWTLGKNADGSGVMGAIVTADEIGSIASGLRIRTLLNGETMQDGSTADMVYPLGNVIAYLSEIVTLLPGDVIATGTPEGIGAARKPPVFLKPGDTIEIEIERVGRISNPVIPYAEWRAR
jgi:2,4-didehydro-3-deoxy-L-rhamnonate hydrolase